MSYFSPDQNSMADNLDAGSGVDPETKKEMDQPDTKLGVWAPTGSQSTGSQSGVDSLDSKLTG